MLELFSLKGKVALVTGASRGLGKPIAKGLAGAGAHVILVARDRAKLDAVKTEIEGEGGTATVLSLDLADEAAIREGVRRVGAELGRLDICVNNAGIINWQPLLDSDEDDFQKIMDTNVRATFVMSQECAALMRAGGEGGRIVNTGSVLGPLGRAKLHAYCGSKSAIIGLTRSLAFSFGPKVRVNAIAPGYHKTEMTKVHWQNPPVEKAIAERAALKRWGDVDDLVGVALFLASPAARFITGACIPVDGGYSIG